MTIVKGEDSKSFINDAFKQPRSLLSRELLNLERDAYIEKHNIRPLLPPLPYKMLVIIPAFNEAQDIEGTLMSLALQTNQDFATVVVDNGSTDGTSKKVKSFSHERSLENLFLLEETRKGVAYARKKGMDQAVLPSVGDIQYIACTDADTKVPPDWVKRFYQAFDKNPTDVLSGEIYFLEDRYFNEDLFFIDQARAALMRHIRPSLNGANFAIRTPSYVRIDGIEQPLTKDGIPLQGSDRHLAYKVLASGGNILHIPTGVLTSPRRYINHMLKDAPSDGTIYGSKGMTDVRNISSAEIIRELPPEVIREQVDRMLKSLFAVYVCQTYSVEVNRKRYWAEAKELVAPLENEFISDIESGDDRNTTENVLWEKYGKIFLNHLVQLVENDKNH